MPDFSQLEYSDWLDTITLCITVAGISLGLIYSQILHSPPTRQRFIAVLQKSKVRSLYQAGVLWLLSFLQRFYDSKTSLQAFNISLLLAYTYPILFFLFGYSYLGGVNDFSHTVLLPMDLNYRSWVFLGVIFFAGAVVFLIFYIYKFNILGIKSVEKFLHPKWPKITWYFLMGCFSAICFFYLFESIEGAAFGFLFGTSWGVGSLFLVVFIFIFSFFQKNILISIFVYGIFFAMSFFVLLMLFSVILLNFAPLSTFIIFFLFLAAMFTLFSASFFALSDSYSHSLLILFFYFFMPLINALLDWLSWWVSRYFMERTAAEKVSVRIIVLDIVLDFIIAVLFMLILVLLLPAGAIGLDALYEHTVDAKTGLTPQTNWQDYAVWARDEPWGKGIMVTLMLVTTLIPTLLHIFLGLMAFYIHAFKGQALAAFLSAANPEDNIANMQASVWVFGYAVLAVLSMWLLWLGINQLWHLPIAEWLYNFAKFFYPLP